MGIATAVAIKVASARSWNFISGSRSVPCQAIVGVKRKVYLGIKQREDNFGRLCDRGAMLEYREEMREGKGRIRGSFYILWFTSFSAGVMYQYIHSYIE